MKIYVGNLNFGASEEFVHNLFSPHGEVEDVWLITTRVGSPHGHGFVHMPNGADAEKAIAVLDGMELNGRPISVNKARG